MHELTGFQRDMLYIVAGLEEPHGLTVKGALDDYYGQSIHHGRLYTNLDALVDKGLVAKGKLDRRTNVYSLTQQGIRELEARREWERTIHRDRGMTPIIEKSSYEIVEEEWR